MKKILTTFAIVLSISSFAQSTISCFNTPDGIDNTWTGGWSYKEYIVPAGFKIDSVYGDFDRPGYPVNEEDFIFSFCAGTTVYDVNIATSPFNYVTINTSLYDHWIDLTAFNYSSVGVVRVFLPVNAGATWNDLCFAISPINTAATTCYNTPDGIDNTWTGGWSYKEYIIPAGFKIDSVYGDFDRPGYPVNEEDFIFSFCAGTTVYDVNIATSPFNYVTINTSLYDHWIDLTAFNYSSVGVVRVFLPVNAGAVWNDLCFATSPNTTSINEMSADNTLIYPNPATDFINIKNASGNYLIIDLLGKVVKHIKISSTVQAINIQELNKGIYFLISDEDHSRYKFIKQ